MKLTFDKITIENFKNFDYLEQPLGQTNTVKGANETGKTTFADAIYWCLTGKNSLGEANPNITPASMPDSSSIVTLDIELSDGKNTKTVSLSRCYQAKFNRDKEYTGEHQTICYINESKQSIKDFDKWVEINICDKEIFRLLFDVRYFTENIATTAKEKKWEVQRRLLWGIADIKADNMLTSKRKKFAPLIEGIENYGNSSCYLKVLQNNLKIIENQIKEINVDISYQDKAIQNLQEETKGKTAAQIQQELDNLANEYRNSYSDYLAENRQKQGEQQDLNHKIFELQKQLTQYKADMLQYEENRGKRLNDLSNFSDICPTCGAKLPEEKIKESKMQISYALNFNIELLKETSDRISQTQQQIDELTSQLQKIELPPAPDSQEEYVNKASVLKGQFTRAQDLEKAKKHIVELEGQRAGLFDTRAYLQQQIDLCNEFIDYKCEQASKKINSMFDGITFELFEKNKTNDEIKDCCNIFWQGVPYESLSYSTKFLVSLNIVLGFQNHYGIQIPIVIDNAESIDYIYTAGRQTICLVKQDEFCTECGSITGRKQPDGLWHCGCGNKFKKELHITTAPDVFNIEAGKEIYSDGKYSMVSIC